MVCLGREPQSHLAAPSVGGRSRGNRSGAGRHAPANEGHLSQFKDTNEDEHSMSKGRERHPHQQAKDKGHSFLPFFSKANVKSD